MLLPPGTAQFTERVRSEILKRKDRWRWALNHNELPNYPRDQVRSVLEFWRVTI
jgi:hypothetical protein